MGALVLGAVCLSACDDALSGLGAGRIAVGTNVSGDLPTGTWEVQIVHFPSGEFATKRVGVNQSVIFDRLETQGKWDVQLRDVGLLGPFACDPKVGVWQVEKSGVPFDEELTFETTCTAQLAADAGPDDMVDVGASIVLDGSGSTPGASVSYSWALVAKPVRSSAALASPTAVTSTFDVDEPGVYAFELTVSTQTASDEDTVVITTNGPTIVTISPDMEPPGRPVTIFGTNFSPHQSNPGNLVDFNGAAATLNFVSATELRTTVPSGATTGPVTVTIDETRQTASANYTVGAPVDPWVFELPQGLGDDYRSVSFANATTGMTVGTNGNVLRTTDGGDTWTAVTSIGSGNPRSISVPDPQVAYVVSLIGGGTSHVLKSSDGGQSWAAVRAQAGENHQAVDFVDANQGWVVGVGGSILRTTDGGANWSSQSSSTSNTLRVVFFVNNQLGVALGDNATVVRTTNGGTTWSATSLGGASALNDLWLLDANNGIIVGRNTAGNPLIWTTTDGGATWSPVSHQGLPANLQIAAVSMGSPQVVTLWGDASNQNLAFYRSTDGGVTWVSESGTNPYEVRDIVMFDATTGVATGDGAIFRRQ